MLARRRRGPTVRPGLLEAEGHPEVVDGVMGDHVVPLGPGLVEDPPEEHEDLLVVGDRDLAVPVRPPIATRLGASGRLADRPRLVGPAFLGGMAGRAVMARGRLVEE